MDVSTATFLAAGLSALVAAGTFATAEVIKIRAARGELEYDGASFDVRTRLHAGTSSATPSAFMSTNPLRSGTVILTEPDGRSLPLGPWFELVDADSKGVIGLYDSAPIPRQDNGTDTPLRFTDNASRSRGLVARSADATWYRVRHHVDRP